MSSLVSGITGMEGWPLQWRHCRRWLHRTCKFEGLKLFWSLGFMQKSLLFP